MKSPFPNIPETSTGNPHSYSLLKGFRVIGAMQILVIVLGTLNTACGQPDRSPSTDSPSQRTDANQTVQEGYTATPSNPRATPQTRALFRNLNQVRHNYTLFGHQDTKAYGVHWMNEPGRSDVLEVTGSYPAVYGWDLGGIERGGEVNLDGIPFTQMQQFIREAYYRGGVNTLSWHMDNPLTGGDAWDVDPDQPAVQAILPGGTHHEVLLRNLDKAADFIRELTSAQYGLTPGASDTTDEPHPIPIILRPWHEMNGSWFWWGAPHTSPEAYKELYRFTVTYLHDVHQLHNILWAYSPNSLSELENLEQYWHWYPGDAYTDVLGFDDYYTTWGGYGDEDGVERMAAHLEWLVTEAEMRGKIPALTETGEYTMLTDTTWYTAQLLRALDHNEVTRRIAWVLVWRNANETVSRPDHFYVPYPGHPATADFINFVKHPLIWVETDLPDLYQHLH